MRKSWKNGEKISPSPTIVVRTSDHDDMGGVSTSRQRNHLYFYDDVHEESAARLTGELREAAFEMTKQANALAVSPPPLHIHIHSYGGSLFAGFAILDAILDCPLQVHTHIEGACASAATVFAVGGNHRTVGRHGFVLIHQLSSAFWGKFEEFKDEMANDELLMKYIKQVYKEFTSVPSRQLSTILKKDLWLEPEKALSWGIVDEIRGVEAK